MKKNRAAKIIIIGLIVLILTLLIEVFVFNWNFISQGSKKQTITEITTQNLEHLENGNYRILDDYASIQLLNIDQYVDRLEFKTDAFEENIDLEISYHDKILVDNINSITKKSVNIQETVDSIQISVLDAQGKEIFIDRFKNMNYFQINPFRLLSILLVFLLLVIIAYAILKKGDIPLEIIFLILILSFGFANTLMTPIFYSWDEADHFIKSYNLASGNIIMREGETILYPSGTEEFLRKKHQVLDPNYRTFEEYKEEMDSLMEINYSDTEIRFYPSSALTYTPAPYLFSSIGIWLGKIANLPLIISFYLGRFFNLLMYAFTVFFAIKLIPLGKRLLFACALLPTIVFQAASFSADVVINGLSFLVFALIIKWLFEDKKISLFDLSFIAGCFILITASKVTYAPIFLLVLLFRNQNFISKKKEWLIKLSMLTLGVLTFVSVYLYGNRLGIAQWPIPGVDVKGQILAILSNPFNYLDVLWKTLITQAELMLSEATVSLAYMGHFGKKSLIIVWTMLTTIAIVDVDQESAFLKVRDKGIILLMCLVTIGLSMTALYATFTPLGNDIVLGFQGRYLIPLIFPLLFLFQRKILVPKVNLNILNIIVVVFSGGFLIKLILHVFNLYYR